LDFVPVVAVAGHELRDPLNVFHLTRQLLYRISERPGGDIRGILKKLKLQLDRIISLVDRLLDVGRIRSGKFELELENFNPGDLVKGNRGPFRRSASRRSAHPARRGRGDWPLGSAASGPGRLEHHIQRHKVWSTEAY
jgi:signal transduction histidine kinase